MFAIVLVSLLAVCAAAPRFSHGPPPFRPHGEFESFAHPPHHYDPFGDEIFDAKQFWQEMANELRQLDTVLAQFYEKFPSVSSTQGVEGNQYKITIPLNGFDEKDIVVKAREGMLMVQAVHKLEGMYGEQSYLDIKTLPSNINVTGSWVFEDHVLKITFPLKSDEDTEIVDVQVTEAPVTEGYSREDMEPESHGVDGDADVGVSQTQDKERELFNNEIPRNSVEATTYAVDLKDEVEFVPVRYR